MKLFLTLVVCFFINNIYSQNVDIKHIRFHHQNIISVGSGIDVFIDQDDVNNNLYQVAVETFRLTKKYIVNRNELLKLRKALFKILPKDILSEEKNCLDGSDTVIQFSNDISESVVKYSVNCISSGDDKTAWKDYLIAVNLILDLAKLKFSDLQ